MSRISRAESDAAKQYGRKQSDELINSEGADERDHLITVEEAAIIPCNKTNVLREVVDEAPQVHVKPNKKKKAWSIQDTSLDT